MPQLESAKARMEALQRWLDQRQAVPLWEIDTSKMEGFTHGSRLTAYMIGKGICIVQVFNGGNAWDIYTPTIHDRSIDGTLADAGARLGVTP